MIVFWIVCAILTAIALAFVLPPLLQSSRETSSGHGDGQARANVDIYRDQIAELEADVNNGIVSREQYQQDRDEIERRLLEDVYADDVVKKGTDKKGSDNQATPAAVSSTPVYAIALAIPLAAVALYFQIGNRAALSGSPTSGGTPARASLDGSGQPSGQMTQAGIEANVAKLAARLEQNPGDVQGWIMLGRSYLNLEKYSDASRAYAKASALKPDDADLLVDYAVALGMANGQRLSGQPLELINKALKLAPENPKALELAGSAAFEAKNYGQAISYWEKLLLKTPPNTELGQALTERIKQAKSLAGTGAK